jgi:hypothetical protein
MLLQECPETAYKTEINSNSWTTTKTSEDCPTQLDKNWVLEIAKSCFSLISVLPIQRTPHFSAT